MYQYICHTKQGKWAFYAASDVEALRLALYFCWRDGETFEKVVSNFGGHPYTLRLCKIDKTNSIQTL